LCSKAMTRMMRTRAAGMAGVMGFNTDREVHSILVGSVPGWAAVVSCGMQVRRKTMVLLAAGRMILAGCLERVSSAARKIAQRIAKQSKASFRCFALWFSMCCCSGLEEVGVVGVVLCLFP
jgi:hypothetical protein